MKWTKITKKASRKDDLMNEAKKNISEASDFLRGIINELDKEGKSSNTAQDILNRLYDIQDELNNL